MFGLGIWEIVTILFVVVVLVNPRDWPKLLYKMGKVYGEMMTLFRSTVRMVRDLETTEQTPKSPPGPARSPATEASEVPSGRESAQADLPSLQGHPTERTADGNETPGIAPPPA